MSKFQSYLNRIVPGLSREELADFVIALSRKLPEESHSMFLRELERVRKTVHPEPQSKESEQNPSQLRTELAQVRERLKDIESGALTLDSEFGPGKWDWEEYDLEDYVFSDPMGVGGLLEQAASLISRLMAAEMSKEASELTLRLLDLEVAISGDGEDEEGLCMENLLEVGIVSQRVRYQLIDGLSMLYSMEPTVERTSALLNALCSGSLSVTLKDLLRGREQDAEHNRRFLHLLIQLVEDSDAWASEALLTEAISTMTEGAETRSLVQRCGASHPCLYEWLLTPGNWSNDPEELLTVGEEALPELKRTGAKYAEIALLCADSALQLDKKSRAEELWLEAFQSEPDALNLLRLVAESNDYNRYRACVEEIVAKVNEERRLREGGSNNPYIQRMLLSDEMELVFLSGDYDRVLREGLSCDDYLGWSLTPLKKCIDFLLFALDSSGETSALEEVWMSVGSWLGFNILEYNKGLNRSDVEGGKDELKRCLRRWKEYHPVMPLLREAALERLEPLLANRTEAIVRGGKRNYYQECARWLVALGTIQEADGVRNAQNDIIDRYEARYPRHTAFRRELEAYRKR